jgi:hypothetical protein
MPIIHLIDGEKGGIGKSMFARCLAHYFAVEAIEYKLIDTDPNNPDVAEVYEGITEINFKASDEATAMNSPQAAQVDLIFEMAYEQEVLVNLPANVHASVAYWILDNDLLEGELIKEANIKIYKWFFSNGSYNSVNLFLSSLDTYSGKLPHIFVRNYGLNSDWSNVEKREDFKKAENKYQFQIIDFPGLRATERDYLEENRIPFSVALEAKNLPILSKQRLTKFLRHTMEQINQTEIFSKIKDV